MVIFHLHSLSVVAALSLQIPACHLSSDITSDEEGRVYGSLRLREPTTRLLYVTPEKVRSGGAALLACTDFH